MRYYIASIYFSLTLSFYGTMHCQSGLGGREWAGDFKQQADYSEGLVDFYGQHNNKMFSFQFYNKLFTK